MNRADGIARLASETFDILVIGGGATGLGAAVDAAARGYRTALVERGDFAGATSSRSTKLIHGGVRYLQRGDVGLVREALRERETLRRNAPHLVRELAFAVPAYRWFELPYYAVGLKAYDALAGGASFPLSRAVGSREACRLVPALNGDGLRGAIVYADGQFDDARLAIALARTAVDRGAAIANYVRAVDFVREHGRIVGIEAADGETNRTLTVRAKSVINATGIFADELRRLDAPGAPALLAHSRGSHIVVRAETLGVPTAALLVPRTRDGRVLFATPWHGHIVIGTTDVPVAHAEMEPVPTAGEMVYMLETVNRYLSRTLGERDVVATFAGLRPLVNRHAATTAKLSREHVIDVSESGLVTVTGGKWTTYRKMAEDAVDMAALCGELPRTFSTTAHLELHGAEGDPPDASDTLRVYGSDAAAIAALARHDRALGTPLHPRLPYTGAEVVYGVRHEMARTVDDVLARRTRAAALEASAAREIAPAVAALLARELGRDGAWEAGQVRAFVTAPTTPAASK